MSHYEPEVCLLCGYEEGAPGEVRATIVRFPPPKPGEPPREPYGWTRRCKDRAGCRARADAAGREWVVDDSKPDVAQRPAASQPVQPAIPAPAHEPEPDPAEQLLEVFG